MKLVKEVSGGFYESITGNTPITIGTGANQILHLGEGDALEYENITYKNVKGVMQTSETSKDGLSDAVIFFLNIFQKFVKGWQTLPSDFKIFKKGSLDADIALEGETVKRRTIKGGIGIMQNLNDVQIPKDTEVTIIGKRKYNLVVNIYQWDGEHVIIPKDLVIEGFEMD